MTHMYSSCLPLACTLRQLSDLGLCTTAVGCWYVPCVCTAVGEAVAKKRRLSSSKGFDFFVESSFVELYNETCRDLYSKSGPAGAPNLPVSAGALSMLWHGS